MSEPKTKRCTRCRRGAPEVRFHKRALSPDGLQAHCSVCRAVHTKSTARRSKDKRLKRKYGVSLGHYEGMVAEQENRCALCGGKSQAPLHLDHNHKTKRVRRPLCTNCNRGLGFFKDNAKLLREAANYIEFFQGMAP